MTDSYELKQFRKAFNVTLKASRKFAEGLEPRYAQGIRCRLDTIEASFLNAYTLSDLDEMCRAAKQINHIGDELVLQSCLKV